MMLENLHSKRLALKSDISKLLAETAKTSEEDTLDAAYQEIIGIEKQILDCPTSPSLAIIKLEIACDMAEVSGNLDDPVWTFVTSALADLRSLFVAPKIGAAA